MCAGGGVLRLPQGLFCQLKGERGRKREAEEGNVV